MRFFCGTGIRSLFSGALIIPVLAAGAILTDSVYAETISLPLSNRQVAEQVMMNALDSLGIPEGKGAAIRIGVDGDERGQEILETAAAEFLTGHGYRVARSDTLPELHLSVDTLYVSLDRKGKFRKKEVRRRAEAHIEAVFRETPDTRKVFQGRGKFEDAFPGEMLDHVGRDNSFVVDRGGSFAVFRPVLFGIAVTGLIWLLYSYRG